MGWQRFAVYWLPDGRLGNIGSEWLGWNARTRRYHRDALPDTQPPRPYGFHATIKPPFRLAPGASEGALRVAFRGLAEGLDAVDLGPLSLHRLGGFLALTPEFQPRTLAARTVEALDGFRAAPTGAELARRRAAGLTPVQDALLRRWGYPYVMDEFRLHLTLTGRNPSDLTETMARRRFDPLLGDPVTLARLSLVGEDALGRFHLIEDAALHDTAAVTA